METEIKTPAAEESPPEKMVKVLNKGPGAYVHGKYSLAPHGDAEVPESVAKEWLGIWHKNVVVFDGTTSTSAANAADADRREAELLGHLSAANKANMDAEARIKNLEAMLEKAQATASGQKRQQAPKLAGT